MILLEKALTLYPAQTKTNVCFDIPVLQDFDRLEIDVSYGPKFVTDEAALLQLTLDGAKKWGIAVPENIAAKACPPIANMVVLSLDINGKFCGYAHRHDPEQHIVVSEQEATPGFRRMRPEKGVWHLVLPVCLVAVPELAYRLRVAGYGKEETA